jgi:cysteine desulfurase
MAKSQRQDLACYNAAVFGQRVYLDFAASTPVDPEVLQAMLPYFQEHFGNPSSVHFFGQQAEAAIEAARRTIAAGLGCPPRDLIFTSGGSESDNLAIRGLAFSERERRGAVRLITTPVEHPAVLNTARALAEHHGFSLTLLPVDEFGRVNPSDLAAELASDVVFASVVYGNNEIGTVNPISDLANLCADQGIPFHTDAVQAAAHLDLTSAVSAGALVSLGAHKMYGPKGVGLLRVPSSAKVVPQITGGGQEQAQRAGTHNVPLIVGMAAAFRLCVERRALDAARSIQLRQRIVERTLAAVPESRLTGHAQHRLPNHASFAFRQVDGNALLAALDMRGFGCSSGSACKTGDPQPSGVLLAIGLDAAWARGSLRVTVGRTTRDDDVESFLASLPQAVDALRPRPNR